MRSKIWKIPTIALFFLTAFAPFLNAAPPVSMKLEPFDGPAPRFKNTSGTYEIKASMSVKAIPATAPSPADLVIEFDYFCLGGVPAITARPGPPFDNTKSHPLPPLVHSETWTPYSARLAAPPERLPADWKQIRIDLTLPAEGSLQIRNLRLRQEKPGEFDKPKAPAHYAASQEALKAYSNRKFTAAIHKVSVGENLVRIEGNTGKASGEIFLADIPIDVILDDPRGWETRVELKPRADGTFLVDVPRNRKRDGLNYDRLSSRWQIVRKTATGYEPLSHARYALWVKCRSPQLAAAKPSNKKGLGGWNVGRIPEKYGTDELADLGISAVTVNILIHSLVALTPGPDTIPFQWQGRTYYAREKVLARHDATFREAAKRRAMVSAILLVANPARGSSDSVAKLLAHPDAKKEGSYAMPNVTSPEGISLYGAILNLMAERWSRPDGKYGRVHHWIIHNEVDIGWVWTNAGDKTDVVYMDLYQRSMRLMHLIAAQYDPHARSFITLTHWWHGATMPHSYGSRRMLELLLESTKAEGDFPWALALHPYPQSLTNPRTWEDKQATFNFNTLKITPKNLEVLDAYMKQPALLFEGKVRPVHLSENGFNSKDYSPKQLEDQAAGMAYAWKKMANLSSIESWQYHNWIDNRVEGGLRIGLRKFPDEPGDPFGKKPIWHLYQALGTPREDAVCAPYLKTIGIPSWDSIIHRSPQIK